MFFVAEKNPGEEFWPRRGAKAFFAGELSMALISATQRFILVEIFALLRG
ncbi:hypothetical protein OPIT5_14055 [Opitutaceae bacterium TAV5]|nr:hypothetical protein OPIT5_14055 [Opitutaceae bacterium TAV5]